MLNSLTGEPVSLAAANQHDGSAKVGAALKRGVMSKDGRDVIVDVRWSLAANPIAAEKEIRNLQEGQTAEHILADFKGGPAAVQSSVPGAAMVLVAVRGKGRSVTDLTVLGAQSSAPPGYSRIVQTISGQSAVLKLKNSSGAIESCHLAQQSTQFLLSRRDHSQDTIEARNLDSQLGSELGLGLGLGLGLESKPGTLTDNLFQSQKSLKSQTST